METLIEEKTTIMSQPPFMTEEEFLEFWLNPEWLWQESLPNVLTIAKELKIKI